MIADTVAQCLHALHLSAVWSSTNRKHEGRGGNRRTGREDGREGRGRRILIHLIIVFMTSGQYFGAKTCMSVLRVFMCPRDTPGV